jgi:flagellar assembly protein FliH
LISPFEFQQATQDAPSGIAPFVAPPSQAGGAARLDEVSAEAINAARIEGHRAGFKEGTAAAHQEAQAEQRKTHDAQMSELRLTVQRMADYRPAIRTEVEREVVDLAFAVARRVLRREITLDPMAAAGIVRSCMDERSAAEVTRILVHAEDLESSLQLAGGDVLVEASADIERGGALLETTRGVLDARIDSQIDELKTGLADG